MVDTSVRSAPEFSADETTFGQTQCGPFSMRWVESGPIGAPKVLLLHGLYAGAHSYEWRDFAPVLSQRFRVRVPDLLGAGQSDRPDLEFTRAVVQSAVDALISDAPGAAVVASSLTGSYALRSLSRATSRGGDIGSLILITPPGMGDHREGRPDRVNTVLYELARRTPLGQAIVGGLTSRPSVSWFQRNKTYADEASLARPELDETRRAGRLHHAKHLQLAFVFGRLALDIAERDVANVKPTVVWARGQHFTANDEARGWERAGARVFDVESGLPQVEEPVRLAELIEPFL